MILLYFASIEQISLWLGKKDIDFVIKPPIALCKSINYGIKTGYNKAFIIDKETKDVLIKNDPKSAEVIKPILRGRNIGRYKTEGIKEYLIGTHNGYRNIPRIDVENYPAIKKHLDMYYHEISIRQDQGTTPYNLRNCAYYEEFEKEKIAFPGINRKWQFALIEKGIYISNPMRFITSKQGLRYIRAIIRSDLIKSYWKMVANMQDSDGYQMDNYMVEKIPVPKIEKNEMKKYMDLNDKIDSSYITLEESKVLRIKLNQLVYRLYDLSPEQIKLVDFIVKK